MLRGTVSSLNPERGFGFITADGQEYFFHRNALMGTDFEELAEGLTVEFQASWDEPGDQPGEQPRAVSIRLADYETPAVDHEVLPAEKTAP